MRALLCSDATPLETLIAYRQGELDEEEEARLEAHVFECEACTTRLEGIGALARGVAALVRAGRVAAAVSTDLLAKAASRGLVLRSYRIAPGGTVHCTAAPNDDFLVIRLAADLRGAERIDVAVTSEMLPTGERASQRVEDVAVDAKSGEILMLYPGDFVRALPRSRWRYVIRASGPGGERTVGPFDLDHTPWEALPH